MRFGRGYDRSYAEANVKPCCLTTAVFHDRKGQPSAFLSEPVYEC
jgi:hypothetical protein